MRCKKREQRKLYVWFGMITAAVFSAFFAVAKKRENKYKNLADKNIRLFLLQNRWMQISQQGITVTDLFNKCGYTSIAVYGMGLVGERLLDELRNSNITVCYGIDQKAHSQSAEIELYSMYDELPAVDAVVVTAITSFDAIKAELEKKINCPILSLEDMLYEYDKFITE